MLIHLHFTKFDDLRSSFLCACKLAFKLLNAGYGRSVVLVAVNGGWGSHLPEPWNFCSDLLAFCKLFLNFLDPIVAVRLACHLHKLRTHLCWALASSISNSAAFVRASRSSFVIVLASRERSLVVSPTTKPGRTRRIRPNRLRTH